ncbi:hypothetical protein [uncultured Flavonifractor sp.]|uniref:hypothetical protein n=1 Tax=uncultured Flavonifractor sp. TaxID=1193534 RepID=UPI00261A919E|nr:hypothetical protein [uncultured Flavonifractor sp.]
MGKLNWLINKIKPWRPLYHLYRDLIVILWLLLLITCIQSCCSGTSFLLIWLEESGMRRFITATPIRSVADTIGFGSILLVWIYAVLDKQELGFRYSKLLGDVYPRYHFFVIGHLLAILLCIGMSEAGVVDIALIALIIVFWGDIIHFKAMFLLIFQSEDRRRAAADAWEQRLIRNKAEVSYLSELCNVTNVLGLETDPAAQRIRSYFYCGLVRYAMSIEDYSSAGEKEIKRVLSDLAQVWNLLLRPRTNSERLLLAGEVLGMANSQDAKRLRSERPECLGLVCLAYVICVYRLCDEGNVEANEEDAIRRTNRQLKLTCLRCDSQEMINYLLISKQLLAWMSFYANRIPFDTSLFMETDKCECPGDKEMLYAMICLLLPDWGRKNDFDVIYSQLFSCDYQLAYGEEDGHDSTSHPTETDSQTECGVL